MHTNDSLVDIRELNGERESETNREGDRPWHDDSDGKTACGRLKISFVDMTYPGQRPEPPSLSPHFLLVTLIAMTK